METNNWNQTGNRPWGAMNVFTSFKDFDQHKYFPLQLLFCQNVSILQFSKLWSLQNSPRFLMGPCKPKPQWWCGDDEPQLKPIRQVGVISLGVLSMVFDLAISIVIMVGNQWQSQRNFPNQFEHQKNNLGIRFWIFWHTEFTQLASGKHNKKSGSFDTLQVPKKQTSANLKIKLWKRPFRNLIHFRGSALIKQFLPS